LTVARQVTRIAGEILVRAELQRIDEDAHGHALGELAGAVHEAQMALVQVAHGGNEADGMTARALGTRPRAHLGKVG